MVFPNNGVVTASKITPSQCGLLYVAQPENSEKEDLWTRGFSQERESELYAANLWDDTDTVTASIASDATPTRHTRIKPFFIEAEEVISTFGLTALDRFARLSRQLEGVTQKALEAELWTGEIRRNTPHDNPGLTSVSATVLNSGTALSPKRALAFLEYSIGAASPCGEQGVIHVTRDLGTLLASDTNLVYHDSNNNHMKTFGGTPLVIGSGYTGSGIASVITNKALTSNEAVLTTSAAHYIAVGDTVTISGVGSPFDGTFTTIAGTTGSTIKYAKTATNVTSVASTGFAQQQGTATTKWMYATGKVKVYLGKVDMVNDGYDQAYNNTENTNNMRFKAIRPAAVYFDSSIHLAIKVDLTA
jgi:hypothetical protein